MGNAENGAQPQLSKRAQIANPFRAMVFGAMADEMIADGTDVVKLSLGEPDFGAPPAVRDAMREQYDGRPLPYTAAMGLPELRQAISDFYKERHHVDVDPKRIAITAGGSTALLLSAALTVNDDDEVLIADPSYPCNRELVRAFGGKVVDVPTSAATRFHLTPELCKEYWTDRTKAVMITSPSNPTGTTIAFDTLKAVCDLARERGAWRIVDETYLDLADREPDGSDVKSVLACDPDAIVCSSFSKFFGMTGWRLGWMVARSHGRPRHQLLPVRAHADPACGARLLHAGNAGRVRGTPSGTAGAPPHCGGRSGRDRSTAGSRTERRVLRVFQHFQHRFGRVDVLRACAEGSAYRVDAWPRFRRGHRGYARAPVVRGFPRSPARRIEATR